MTREKVAIIIGNDLGWASIRKTWETKLSQDETYEFVFIYPEDRATAVTKAIHRLGRFTSMRAALAGRAAAKEAIRRGCRKLVVGSSHYAAFLPSAKGVRYYVYGDATPRQLETLGYSQHEPDFRSVGGLFEIVARAIYRSMYDRAFRRLSRGRHHFLCVSAWYAEGLAHEHDIPSDRIAEVPFSVDTDYWRRSAERDVSQPLRILFVGGDFYRKGGPELLAVSEMADFQDCQFDFVTLFRPERVRPNAVFHSGMKPNSAALRDLVQSCDIFVLPTRADCSSIATLEAASCGLPAIVTETGGVGEIVEHGRTGMIIESQDVLSIAEAIRTYQRDRQQASIHGAAARRRVARHFDDRVSLGALKAVLGAVPDAAADGCNERRPGQ